MWAMIAVMGTSWSAQAKEHIIRFADKQAMKEFVKQAKKNKTVVKQTIPQLFAVVVEGDPREQQSLSTLASRSLYIQENKVIKLEPVKQSDLNAFGKEFDPTTRLWGMKAIKAKEAWKTSMGQDVIVAISDTGVWPFHGDLKDKMWNNPGETGKDAKGKDKSKNGIDDDGNGYVDDIYGWDFVSKKRAILDNHYHGTHVAGTVAANYNKHGVVGAAPKAKIMISTFINGEGSGTDAGGAQSIIYAADNGAKVINCSWGGEGSSQVIEDAIAYAAKKNVLVVAAAGNSSKNTDKHPHIPSASVQDNVVSVGATMFEDGVMAFFSNYGKASVDLAAPGHNIESTSNYSWGIKQMWRTLSGTSMAAPHVSGVAALIFSLRPDFTWKQVKEVLLESAEPNKNWDGFSVTGGVLRADKAVELALSK